MNILGLAAAFKKISVMEGWTWMPTQEYWENHRQYGTLRTTKCDWTIMKDYEKGWTNKAEQFVSKNLIDTRNVNKLKNKTLGKLLNGVEKIFAIKY